MTVTLLPYAGQDRQASDLIRQFWLAHSGEAQSETESREDLSHYTSAGHRFFFLCADNTVVVFAHLGSRGARMDWLEELFVCPRYQGQGIGTEAIRLLEALVSADSESMYIEVAARNERAIQLYRRTGFNCLNTVTLRKDFDPARFETVSCETLLGEPFVVRSYRTYRPF